MDVLCINLEDLERASRRDEVEVELAKEDGTTETLKFWFQWNPNRVTARRVREVDEQADATGSHEVYSRFLAYILTDWCLAKDGHPAPITAEQMDTLPLQWQIAIANRVMAASRPNSATGGPSSGFSGTEETPPGHQAGSD